MMTSSNGNIFRVTGPLWGNPPVTGGFPSQRPVTRSFDVFFDLRLNKRLSKQSRRRGFEAPSPSLWRYHMNPLRPEDTKQSITHTVLINTGVHQILSKRRSSKRSLKTCLCTAHDEKSACDYKEVRSANSTIDLGVSRTSQVSRWPDDLPIPI